MREIHLVQILFLVGKIILVHNILNGIICDLPVQPLVLHVSVIFRTFYGILIRRTLVVNSNLCFAFAVRIVAIFVFVMIFKIIKFFNYFRDFIIGKFKFYLLFVVAVVLQVSFDKQNTKK